MQECDLLDLGQTTRGEAASRQLQGWLAECLGPGLHPPEARLAEGTRTQIGEWLAVQAGKARVSANGGAGQTHAEVRLQKGGSTGSFSEVIISAGLHQRLAISWFSCAIYSNHKLWRSPRHDCCQDELILLNSS